MSKLKAVYENVVGQAAHGEEPVTLPFSKWLEVRAYPLFEALTSDDQIACLGSEAALNDYNVLETELYETNRFNGSFNTNPLI